MRVADFFNFVRERHAIYERRSRGLPKPWTQDPILQKYKFCNMYRELDTVTIWIRDNWRTPHENDPHLWFAMAVARYINWPDALTAIKYPVPFRAATVAKVLKKRKERGEQVFTGAYFINSIGPKIDSVVFDRLDKLWLNRTVVSGELERCTKLSEAYAVLHEQFGFGSFMVGQVIADLKYTGKWKSAPDWWTWAISGPGSKRGLARLLGRPITTTINYARKPENRSRALNMPEKFWHEKVLELQSAIAPLLKKAKMPPMHAQDVQGCLCEVDKYLRVQSGEGKPRSRYPGGIDVEDVRTIGNRKCANKDAGQVPILDGAAGSDDRRTAGKPSRKSTAAVGGV